MNEDPDRCLEKWLAAAMNREATGVYADCKLDPIRAVLARLSAPPAPITVAGTKGKGSTVRFLEQALLACGRQTVSFTSPHVRRLRERWRLDGDLVPPSVAWQAAERVAVAEGEAGVRLTYFERCFALACVLAADRPQADFLLEVGLGGRLDCANALDARIAIVTHIGYDHCHILGHTLAAIAREKCAIARPGRPLLLAPQSLLADADLTAALPPGVTATRIAALPSGTPLGLAGDHQLGNAATALAACRLSCPEGDGERARAAIAATTLAARCQLIEQPDGRRILVDAGHHDESIAAALREAARALRPGWLCLFGLAKDKEWTRILRVLPSPNRLWRCGYRWDRAATCEDWPAPLRSCPWYPDIAQALAALPADRDCCIVGSFYLAGEALDLLTPDGHLPG